MLAAWSLPLNASVKAFVVTRGGVDRSGSDRRARDGGSAPAAPKKGRRSLIPLDSMRAPPEVERSGGGHGGNNKGKERATRWVAGP